MNIITVAINSPFRIGLILLAISSIWIGIIFSGTEKISQDKILGLKEISALDLDLKGKGLGFYKIIIPGYSKEIISVKVSDPNGNFLDLRRIETKMSVNYFEFGYSGRYTLEITNLSENPIEIKAEFGNTKSSEFSVPLLFAFFAVGLIAFSGYKRLQNHRMAQPEENNP